MKSVLEHSTQTNVTEDVGTGSEYHAIAVSIMDLSVAQQSGRRQAGDSIEKQNNFSYN